MEETVSMLGQGGAISGFAPPIVERGAVEGVGDDDKSTVTQREMSEEGVTIQ